MSESGPKISYEQQVSAAEFTEGLPPRDEAIDTIRDKMVNIQEELDQAKERAEKPGFKATANDLVEAKMGYRDLRAEKEPDLEAIRAMWAENGGAEIEAAEEAAAKLNFRSDANDHVAAKTRLRDAKDAFYANLQANETRFHDSEEAYDLAYEEAADKTRVHDEGEAYDQAHEEKDRLDGEEALEELIAGSLALRQMDMLSKEIDEMRREGADAARRKEKEDLLNDLLVEYEESDDFDPAIADMFMDRDDTDARRDAGKNALLAKNELDDEDEKDPGSVNTNPLEGKGKDDDKNKDPGSVNTDPLENKSNNGNEKDPGSVNTNPLEGRGRSATETQPIVPLPERRERMSRGRKIALALGGAAVVLVGAALASKGFTDNPFRGMGDWIASNLPDWMSPTEAIEVKDHVLERAPVNTDGFIDTLNGNPPVDTLPPSEGFQYPWNWAEKAVGANDASTWLHELGNKAAASGKAVEWVTQADGTEYVKVNGNSNTQYVIDTLRQFR